MLSLIVWFIFGSLVNDALRPAGCGLPCPTPLSA